VPDRELAHPVEHGLAEALPLVRRGDLDGQRRERVRGAARRAEPEGVLDEPVDAGRQSRHRAVPGARDRMALREHDVGLVVVEGELEIGELLVEAAPVFVEDVAVLVVLGPDARDLLVRALPQVGPLGARDRAEGHAPASRRSAA
jgi:hypothetical protein